MRHNTRWFFWLAIMSFLLVSPTVGFAEVPKLVVVSTHSVGSMAYVFTSGIAQGVEEKAGIKTRVLPSGTDMSKMLPARNKEAQFVVFTGGSGWFVSRGAGTFATPDWGPQRLRIAWRGGDLFVGGYTRGDSGVKRFADLKGRRVAQVPGYPAANNLIKGMLAYDNLSLDDVKVVTLASHGAAAKALTAGQVDMYVFGTTGALPMETAASAHGIYWIPFDPKNKEGIKRLLTFAPWPGVGPVTRYAGKKEGDPPFIGLIYPYCYFCYEELGNDLVYAYAKGIWESYDIYKNKSADLPYWDHKAVTSTIGGYYPYHEGIVKLLREKGVWSAELEQYQKEQLSREAAREALWKKFRETAKAKNLKTDSEEFKDAWWEMMKEAELLL